jgi:hypothetical protein
MFLMIDVQYLYNFKSVVHFCLQEYLIEAKASAGLGNKTGAIKYLEDGIQFCANSNTEELHSYHQTLNEEDLTSSGQMGKTWELTWQSFNLSVM